MTARYFNPAIVAATLLAVGPTPGARAAGSGLNTLVVINQASTNSIQLGNYYAERRQVPPQNIVRVTWTGGNTSWSTNDFATVLRAAVTNAVMARGLSNQISGVVLSMDLPFSVSDGSSVNSTTAALFYGFKADGTNVPGCPTCPLSCTLPDASSNSYAASESIFRQVLPGISADSFLTTMITAGSLAQAKAIVDSGVNSDGTFPTNRVWLEKTSDPARNVRFINFDDAEFNFRVNGSAAIVQTNSDQTSGLSSLLGLQTGLANLTVSPGTFTPGAMADSLTSYGGVIFGPNGQTTLLAFTDAGAAGAYGTVVEPCNYLEKFPSPQNYFYQQRGFSLAESYYLSLANPYQGLIVAEPLAAPFARGGTGSWPQLPDNAVLAGTTNLALQFTAADATRPLQRVDLFVDGRFFATMTNLVPLPGNRVQAVVNNHTLAYTVQNGDTIADVAAGLAADFNTPANQALLNVDAVAHGDRIELKSADVNRTGVDTTNGVTSLTNTAGALTTFIRASRTNFLDTFTTGYQQYGIGVSVVLNDYLILAATKTNGQVVTVAITNNAPSISLYDFVASFLNKINATNALQGADGLLADGLTVETSTLVSFYLRPRSAGRSAARIQTLITGLFDISPATNVRLEQNLGDLEPRNHFFVTAGATNLAVNFPLNTAALGDGWHELTAVACEGSHVATQTRVSRTVRVQNSALSATFATLVGGSNTAVEATLQFQVAANTNVVTKIELFSTGGLLATVSNLATANFSVAGTNLGVGLHPFYAVVTAGTNTWRTETKILRLVNVEPPFPIALNLTPTRLAWTAIAGRRYDVLSTTNLNIPFGLREAVVPTNFGTFTWAETNSAPAQYYRLQIAP